MGVCLCDTILVALPCANLLGSCLKEVRFAVWLQLVLLVMDRSVVVRVNAGLEELEGLGRECDSPRKRPVHWFGDMEKYML